MFKNAASKIAHNTTLPVLGGNKDLKPLQDLITAEKTVLTSMQKLSVDIARSAEALRVWALNEGPDLGDVMGGSSDLLFIFSTALTAYAGHENAIRDHMKTIRTREEQVEDMRKHRKTVASKLEAAEKKLSRMGSEHKNLATQENLFTNLREELRVTEMTIMTEEAALGDLKRAASREFMALKFCGLLECSEKGTIVGEMGKLLIAEIPQDTTQPGHVRSYYAGQPKTASIVQEAQRCASQVKFTQAPSPSMPTPSIGGAPPSHQQGLQPPEPFRGPSEWSVRGAEGETAPTTAPPYGSQGHLGAPSGPSGSGQGLGHFMYPSEAPSTQTNFDSETTTLGYSRDPSQAYSVDDMGTLTPGQGQGQGQGTTGSGWGGHGGGQYATVPVKSQGWGGAGRGVILRDDGPRLTPSVLGSAGIVDSRGSSFEVEVNKALLETSKAFTSPDPAAAGRSSTDSSPSQSTQIRNAWANQQHARSESDNSAQLPYTTDSEESHGPRNRHVRFGGGNDVNDELTKREPPLPNPPTDQAGVHFPIPQPYPGPQPSQRVPPPIVTASLLWASGQSQAPPLSDEDERARNAAAAQDASREIALSPQIGGLSSSPPRANANMSPPSPLIPPAPPFALSPLLSADPQIRRIGPSSTSESSPSSNIPLDTQGSSRLNYPPASASPGPLNLPKSPLSNIPVQSWSASASSPLSTPGISATLPMSRSTASLASNSSTPAPGSKTISAAAFKRNNQNRSPSFTSEFGSMSLGEGNVPAMADTSPLSVRKRSFAGSSPPSEHVGSLPSRPAPLTGLDKEEELDYADEFVNSANEIYGGTGRQMEDDGNRRENPHPSDDTGGGKFGYEHGQFATSLEI